jgi:hypothetical protein
VHGENAVETNDWTVEHDRITYMQVGNIDVANFHKQLRQSVCADVGDENEHNLGSGEVSR